MGSGSAQRALGRRHLIGLARIDLDRGAQGTGQRLERAFDDMVVVAPVERLDVERDPRRLREAVEPVLEQLGIEIAELGLAELATPDEVGAPRNVYRDARQGFVHRRISGTEALDALAVTQCLRKSLADRQR